MAKLVLELDIEPALIDKITNAAKASKVSLTKYTEKLYRRDIGENAVIDPLEEAIKNMIVPDDLKAVTGILKGAVPEDMKLWEIKAELLKEKHGL